MTRQARTLMLWFAMAFAHAGALTAQVAAETEEAKTTAPAHRTETVCACNYGDELAVFDSAGEIVWSLKPPHGPFMDLHVLPNGNFFFSSGWHVMEMTRDRKVVFDYTVKDGFRSCQRLPNGDTLISVADRLLHVRSDGSIAKELEIPGGGRARLLENGHYLVAYYVGKRVCEYDPAGKVVFEAAIPGGAWTAERLPNGNTLVAVTDKAGIENTKLLEINKKGETVWEFSNANIPKDYGDKPLKFVVGFHHLPGGNILIANWLGHWLGNGQRSPVPQLWEITPDKKIVRTFQHPKLNHIVAIQVVESATSGGVASNSPHDDKQEGTHNPNNIQGSR